MAGSYNHCVTDDGRLRKATFADLIENLGDAFEAVEEMYGMIWYLAQGNAERVAESERQYMEGLAVSPGTEGEGS